MSIWHWLFKSSISGFLNLLPLLFPHGCSTTYLPSLDFVAALLFLPLASLLEPVLDALFSVWKPINGNSTEALLELLNSSISSIDCFSSFLPELSEDVKELSSEHIVPLSLFLSPQLKLNPLVSVSSEMGELGQALLMMVTSWESSAFVSSIPTGAELYPASASCAFFSTDCKYFPWASIRSCKCFCTWNHHSKWFTWLYASFRIETRARFLENDQQSPF